MKTYYVYKESMFFKLYKYVLIYTNNKVLFWKRSDSDKSKNIPYPDNSLWYSMLFQARSHLEKYYNNAFLNDSDMHLNNYFKKRISYIFADYFFFRKAILINKKQSKDNQIIIGPKFLNNIFENKISYSINFNIFSYIYHFSYSLIVIVKSIILCMISRNKIKTPDVFYYFKKIAPQGFKINKFFDRNISISTITLKCGRQSNDYGINYLNNYLNSTQASLKASILMWKYLIKDIRYFLRFNIPADIFSDYLLNSFSTLCLINLKPYIIFGIMEKHPFILLNRYKYNWQKMFSISDGFVYPPIPSLDYVYADTFFYMNNIEKDNINVNGGMINNKCIVGNLSYNKNSLSKGISNELKEKMNNFNYIVLIGTNRLQLKNYFPITKNDLNKFLHVIIDLAANNTSDLFIIKTKKGEYKSFSSELSLRLSKLDNVVIIKSDIPSLEEHNHFEELIEKSNMLISSFFCSTIIWQALSRKIPTIVCNDTYENTFLKKYKYLEVTLVELKEAYSYWKKIDNIGLDKFFSEINMETNVFETNALKKIAEKVSHQLYQIKNSQHIIN